MRHVVGTVLYLVAAWRMFRTVVYFKFVRGLGAVVVAWATLIALSYKMWQGRPAHCSPSTRTHSCTRTLPRFPALLVRARLLRP